MRISIFVFTLFVVFFLLTPDSHQFTRLEKEKLEPKLRQLLQTNSEEKLRVIVFFKEKAKRLKDVEEIHRFDSIPAVATFVSPKKIEEIQQMPTVERIVLDRKVHAFRDVSIPLIKSDVVYSLGYNGTGVNISVVDTGVYNHSEFINPNRLSSLQKCYCCSSPPLCGDDDAGCCPDGTAIDDNATDDHWHGSHCAGIAAGELGVANGSTIIAVKVLDSAGGGYDSDVVIGIEWAVENGANVISLSLGTPYNEFSNCYDLASSQAVDAAVEGGVTVIVAAGNEGSGSKTIAAPGCAKRAITVGASNDNDAIASFSSRGSTDDNRTKPDLTAPGVSINSTTNSLNGYTPNDGTSMATPHVAGVAALVIEKFNRTFGYFPEADRVKTILLNAVNTTGMSSSYEQRNNHYGGGRIDAYEAIRIVNSTVNFTKNDTISSNQTHRFNLNVTDDLRLTLYWPENESISYDLDLIVGNRSYNYSYPTSVNDTVEQVFIYNSNGIWKVFVEGINALNQEYYLVSNMEIINDVTAPSLVLEKPENITYNYNVSLPLNFTTDSSNSTIWYTVDSGNETVITDNTTFNVSEGSHNLTLFVNDSYDNINQSTQYFSVDMMPKWSGNLTYPTSPTTTGQDYYQFNVTWIDDGAIDEALIEHNFTGSVYNDSFNGSENGEYYFNVSGLTVGTYVWKSYANDTHGNENSTDPWTYIVSTTTSTTTTTAATTSVPSGGGGSGITSKEVTTTTSTTTTTTTILSEKKTRPLVQEPAEEREIEEPPSPEPARMPTPFYVAIPVYIYNNIFVVIAIVILFLFVVRKVIMMRKS